MNIDVNPLPDGSWTVDVETAGETTTHVVTVPPGYADVLGCREVADAELVRASLAFLLEREPARSILPRFSLDAIARYFPEYVAVMHEHVRRGPAA